jgi:hypothetical protein
VPGARVDRVDRPLEAVVEQVPQDGVAELALVVARPTTATDDGVSSRAIDRDSLRCSRS